MASTAKPMYDWCCFGSIESPSREIQLETIVNSRNETAFRYLDGKSFDMSVAADWMEWIERSENRMDDEGGAGAYDTLRCDLILDAESDNWWRVWGQAYHLERLTRSYSALVDHKDGSTLNDEVQADALKRSEDIFNKILKEAENTEILWNVNKPARWEDVTVQVIKFTWLWSPGKDGTVIVRGHACCSGKPLQIHENVEPIVVTVAAELAKNHSAVVDETIPTRFRDPEKKVASWTRLRKTMENPDTYKPPGVSEVLLVRSRSSDLEVLEGLSSNFFVVYNDEKLRTAKEGVLKGYVRHLVLEYASHFGLKVDFSPILLKDAEKGLWKEAFITSSSRLIYPISKVLMYDDATETFVEYWSNPSFTSKGSSEGTQKWRQLLDEILTRGGYPRFC